MGWLEDIGFEGIFDDIVNGFANGACEAVSSVANEYIKMGGAIKEKIKNKKAEAKKDKSKEAKLEGEVKKLRADLQNIKNTAKTKVAEAKKKAAAEEAAIQKRLKDGTGNRNGPYKPW